MFEKVYEILTSPGGSMLVAGVLGGVVRVATLQERSWQAFGSLIVGGIMAVYAGPLALPLIETITGALTIEPESAGPLSGFLMGLGGITIAQAILQIYRKVSHKEEKE